MLDIYRFVSILQDELYVIEQGYKLYLNTPCGTFELQDKYVWHIMEKYCKYYDHISITINRYSCKRKDFATVTKQVPKIMIRSIRTSSMQEYVKALAEQIDYEFHAFEKQQGESNEQ